MSARRPESGSARSAELTGGEPASAPARRPGPIVVGLDGRPHDGDALSLARALRGAFGDPLLLVHVLTEAPLGRGMADFQAIERREGQELLADAAAEVSEPVEVELIDPWPTALALERVAFQRHASLIVLGASHRTTLGRIVPGSVALRLGRSSPCPIAIAPVGYTADPAAAPAPVAVAYDATPSADRALHEAAGVAQRLKLPLHVYHAVSPEELDEIERSRRDGSPLNGSGDPVLDGALDQLAPGIDARAGLLSGEPVAAIRTAVGEDAIGLLFAGSRGHGAVRESLFGGVCLGLLQSAPCPVVLIPHNSQPVTGAARAGRSG